MQFNVWSGDTVLVYLLLHFPAANKSLVLCVCVSHSAWGLKCFSEIHSGSTSEVIRLCVCARVCVFVVCPQKNCFLCCFFFFYHAFTMTQFHQPSKGIIIPVKYHFLPRCRAGCAHLFAWVCIVTCSPNETWVPDQINACWVPPPPLLSVHPTDLFFAVFDSVSLNLWQHVLLLCSAMWPLNPPLWASPDALPWDYDVLIYWK